MIRLTRTLAALLLLATALGGCADDEAEGDGPTTYGAPGTTSTTAADEGTSSTPARSPATTRPAAGARTTTTRPQPTATNDTTAGPPPTDEPTPSASQRLGPPGSYARELLRAHPATDIVVEVISQGDGNARSATIAMVEDVLEDATRKPVRVVLRSGTEGAPSGNWDAESIVAFADRHGAAVATSTRPVIRFLALKGGFGPDPNAIGVAVRGDVFAVFVEDVNRSGTPLVDAATIEQAVAVHEVGHLLGLVDIALDRNRDDPDHPHHSRNRGSVMFWAIDTDLVGQILGGPPPRSFDADDQRDLADLRGGQ